MTISLLCAGLLTPHMASTEGLLTPIPKRRYATERYRIRSDEAVYFITYSIVDWLPVFVSEATCCVVIDSFNYCHARKSLCVNAYVIMPTHLHAIVFDRDFDVKRLQQTLTDFCRFTGSSLCDSFETRTPRCFATKFRAASPADRERRFWQPSRHPEAVKSEKFWQQKLDYIHENPYRKGLVPRAADWRYSSAAYYISEGRTPCDLTILSIAWSCRGDLRSASVARSGDRPHHGGHNME